MFREVLLVGLLSLLASRAGAIECTTSDFCRCEGADEEGTKFTIDVGYILAGFETTKIPDTTSEGKDSYTYTLSPCAPVTCDSFGTANGVSCQNDLTGKGLDYVARDTVPAKWNIGSLSPLQFAVVYGDGDKSMGPTLTRNAELDFSQATIDDIEMFDQVVNTDPRVLTLTYKFRVSGPSVTPSPRPAPLACEPVSGDEFCSCRGRDFVLDLRHILSLPVVDIPDKSGEGEAKYSYSFNPCTPFDCERKGINNGLVCQDVRREGRPVEYVNIARDTVPANWTVYSLTPLKFEVLYGGGDRTTDTPVLTRKAKVAFQYTAVGTDVVMNREDFDGENKTLTYDFQIIGKNVTIANVPCEPVIGDEFCSCKGSNFSIDLRHTMPLPLRNIPDGREEYKQKYHYIFSPCTPLDCHRAGFDNGLICQSITREGQATEYITIARDTVPARWTVYSVTPLTFEVLYSGGDSYSTAERKRQARLSFIHSSDGCTLNAFVATEADTGTDLHTYMFEINGTSITTSDFPGSSTDNFQVEVMRKKSGEEAEKDSGSSSIVLPIILGLVIGLAGVACFVIGALTGYYKGEKFRKYGANRKKGWILFNQDPTIHVPQTKKTEMDG